MAEQRQTTRGRDGRYKDRPACPRCGRRRSLEPAYSRSEGGPVRDDSEWGGLFLCPACIKQEADR